jgi:Ca2+-binding RTX toxin-like protein
MPAVRFVIRNYVRNGLNLSFELVAVHANGAVDAGYTGTVSFSSLNSPVPGLPASYTFVPGDAGAHSFSTTIQTVENVQILANVAGGVPASAGIYIGGGGPDSFTGDAGGDVFDPAGGSNTVTGSAGEDLFYLTGGANTLDGGAGSDRLVINWGGGGLANTVALTGSLAAGYSGTIAGGGFSAAFQGVENFTINTSNNETDNITTGDGEDEYSQLALDSPWYIRDVVNLGGGLDRLSVDARGNVSYGASFAALAFDGSGEFAIGGNGKLGFTNVERFFVRGSQVTDNLRGLDYGDRFEGNGGNDQIAGRGGDDDLRGGAGADVIDGDGWVTILLAADNQNNAGTGASDNDFRTLGTYNNANPAEFDLAVGTGSVGTARLRIRATDVEVAAGGFDAEVDQVYVNDVLIGTLAQFADNVTGDTVLSFDAALLASGVARIRIQNVNASQDYSFRVEDVELMVEKTGTDRLDGGAGIDQLAGGRGDDFYVVDDALDQVQEQAGRGTDTVLSQGRWFTLGANLENLSAALPMTGTPVSGEGFVSVQSLGGAQFPRGIVALEDGGYVVTWWDSNNGGDARARVYNADGTPRSAELRVTEVNPGNEGQNGMSAVQLANGNILIATYASGGSGGEQILGRIFDASGVAQGTEFALADAADASDAFPRMERLNSGQVALVWQNNDGGGFGLSYRLLGADGSIGAAPFTFNTTTANDQREPVMAKLDDGRLVVAWESQEPGGDVVRGRFINADGSLGASDFPISAVGGDQYRTSITGINGGGFAVTWEQGGQVLARVYGGDSRPMGSQFVVSETAVTTEINSVTRLPEGGFMVSWASFGGEDGSGLAVLGRLFNDDGSPRGGNFVVNQVGDSYQNAPSIATLANGNVVAAFGSEAFQGGNYDVKQVILDTTPDQTLVGNELANTIAGGWSDDIIAGSGGGDTLTGNQGGDRIYGGEFTGSGTNLVVNGSFETQDGTNVTRDYILAQPWGTEQGISYRDTATLFGWQRGTTYPIELNTDAGSTMYEPADGTADIQMEWGNSQQQILFQDIADLTAGEKYILKFAANQLSRPENFTATLQVLWNGVVVDTVTPQTKTPGYYTYIVEAAATGIGTGGANRLEFREVSSGDAGGTTLDAVSLEALAVAPEMAIGAMGPNLIVNGSFEQRDASTTSRDYTLSGSTDFNGGEPIYRFSDQLLGWSFAAGTTRIEFNTDNPNNPRNEFQTGEGLVGLDLGVGSDSENFGIFQDVAGLAANQRYRITISAALPIGPDQSGALQVIWNGRVVGTITPTSFTPTDYSFDVYAQARGAGADGANRIALQEVGGAGGSGRGTVIDNVRLNLVAAADAGADTVDYSAEAGTGNVTVDLAAGTATDSFGALDTLYRIENARSGAGNDLLIGDGGVNLLDSGSGNDTLDGGGAADTLIGGAGNDIYIADASDTITEGAGGGTDEIRTSAAIYSIAALTNVENLTGTSAAGQTLTGNGGVNVVTGAGGNDTIDGGIGADTMAGNAGNDTYTVDNAGDVVSEAAGQGTDTIRTNLATYSLAALPTIENLTGTSATGQTLTGNGAANVVTGAGGNDTLDGGVGTDTLVGNAGNDVYLVDNAGDTVTESAGAGTDEIRTALATYSLAALANVENLTGTSATGQTLTGNGAANVVTGAGGNDTLDGGVGTDTLVGNAGNDVYLVDNAGDTVTEGAGAGTDEIRTALVSYSIVALANVENLTGTASGGQTLTGNAAVNVISAAGGNDTIDGGAGADTMIGNGGNDTYSVDNAADVVTEATAQGTDTIRTDLAAYSLAALVNVENLTGTSAAGQVLTGNGGINAIVGAGGGDTLDGGVGADTLAGNGGNDIYIVDDAGDTVTESAGGGTDEIRTALAAYSLAALADVENLTGTSSIGQTLTGNGATNAIIGAGGNDTLDGGTGADAMVGNAGNDTYTVDNAGDVVTEAAGQGTDTIRTGLASYSIVALANVENLIGTSAAGQNLTGNGTANAITGAGGNDTIDGGAGIDTMTGGLGNDIYLVDAAGDTVIENAGEGTDEIRTTLASYSLAALANVENLTGTSSTGQTLTGNGVVNAIVGAGGNDTLDGGTGADAMAGNAGNDIYTVDNVGDVVTEAAGQGTDTIRTGLATYSLAALVNVENLTGTSAAGQALTGNASVNAITGAGGNDTLDGGGGADTMAGAAGNDIYFVDDGGEVVVENGGEGTDEIRTALAAYSIAALANVENLTGSAAGGQVLTGNGAINVITGAGGNDTIDGGTGADTMAGNAGNDAYVVDDAGDVVTESAGQGTDEIRTTLTTYSLAALANVENLAGTSASGQTLTGNGAVNTIVGASGNDTIDGGVGADTMAGNAGDDSYVVDNAGDVVTEAAGQGSDTIRTALASYSIAALANVENLTGTSASGQTLTGNGAANVIVGASGNDTIDGGGGIDTMAGGGGNDTYLVDIGGDVVTEAAGQGTDTIRTGLAVYSIAALANIENLTGVWTGGQTLTGNGTANTITGAAGNDTIDGGAGADTMLGGIGNDIYVVDVAGDVVTELAGQGTDTIRTALASYSIAALANVENLIATSFVGQTLTGNGGVNAITGAAGNDTLDGGAGADTMAGAGGNDIYIVDDAGDVVTEGGGAGTDEIRTSLAGYQLAANVEILTYTGGGTASLRGNSGNNTVAGGGGGDLLDLRDGGNETASGGDGDDGFYMGAALNAADVIDGGAGTNDQMGLQGDYSAGLTLAAGTLANLEVLALMSGSDTRFGESGAARYSYSITTDDANIAASRMLTFNANGLLAGENFTLSAAVEIDGSVRTFGGMGVDLITGGQASDGFFFGAGRWGDSDRVDGQGGSDQLGFQGDHSGANALAFGASQLAGIETLVLISASDTRFGGSGTRFSYEVTMDQGNVAGGAAMTINANMLLADETLTFNGAAETDGRFTIFSGAGADVIVGSGGNDRIWGRGGADTLTGGSGNDSFAYASASDSRAGGIDEILDLREGDTIDLATLDANSALAGDQAFTFLGTGAFTNGAGQLRLNDRGGGLFWVEGDVDGNGTVDFQINLTVVDGSNLAVTDFIL